MLLKKNLKILFRLLVILLPTQLAFHFWPKWSFLYGIRIDYFAPAIYLTDLLVILFIFLGLISTYKSFKPSVKTVLIISSLLIFSFLNIRVSGVWQIALFKWIKIGELFLLAFYITKLKLDYYKDFIKPFCLSVLFFSIFTLVQFSFQKSIGGLFYLLGERAFGFSTVGISKVTIIGREFVRAYSSFSHPNSLGGFFLVGLGLLMFSKFNKKDRFLQKCGIVFSTLTVLLSFSLSAYIGLILLFFTFMFIKSSYFLNNKLVSLFLFTSLITSLLLPIWPSYLKSTNTWERSVAQRLYLAEASGKIIAKSPIFGVGLNNFIYALTKIPDTWPQTLQPVHNIFLLVFSEAGLFGLLSFSVLLFVSLKNSWKDKNIYLSIALLLIIFTGLFDHYWLTLNQNQLLFTIILGFSFKKEDRSLKIDPL